MSKYQHSSLQILSLSNDAAIDIGQSLASPSPITISLPPAASGLTVKIHSDNNLSASTSMSATPHSLTASAPAAAAGSNNISTNNLAPTATVRPAPYTSTPAGNGSGGSMLGGSVTATPVTLPAALSPLSRDLTAAARRILNEPSQGRRKRRGSRRRDCRRRQEMAINSRLESDNQRIRLQQERTRRCIELLRRLCRRQQHRQHKRPLQLAPLVSVQTTSSLSMV